jgi:hypothetical protein
MFNELKLHYGILTGLSVVHQAPPSSTIQILHLPNIDTHTLQSMAEVYSTVIAPEHYLPELEHSPHTNHFC